MRAFSLIPLIIVLQILRWTLNHTFYVLKCLPPCCTDLAQFILATVTTNQDLSCDNVFFISDWLACLSSWSFSCLFFLPLTAFSLIRHLVVESLMLPGAPQTTSCKFLLGKPAFLCGSIPGFLKIYIHIYIFKSKQNNSNLCVSVTNWDLSWH